MTAMSGMVFMTDVSSMFTVLVVLAVNAAMTFVCVFRQLLRVIHVCIHSAKLYPPGVSVKHRAGRQAPGGQRFGHGNPVDPQTNTPYGYHRLMSPHRSVPRTRNTPRLRVTGRPLVISIALVLVVLLTPAAYCLAPHDEPATATTTHHAAIAAAGRNQATGHQHIGQPAHETLCHTEMVITSALDSVDALRFPWLAPTAPAILAVATGPGAPIGGRAPPDRPYPAATEGGRAILSRLCVNRR